jgi:hypothetical protein
MFIRYLVTFFFYRIFHRIANSFYLRGVGRLTNNKEISYCFRYFSQVEGYDLFPLLFADSLYNRLENFGIAVKLYYARFLRSAKTDIGANNQSSL